MTLKNTRRRPKAPRPETGTEDAPAPAPVPTDPVVKTYLSFAYTDANGNTGFDFLILTGVIVRNSGQIGGLIAHVQKEKGYPSVVPISWQLLDD